jgi:superfamily II DNA or RNA helicase
MRRSNHIETHFEEREYQENGIKNITRFFCQCIHWIIEKVQRTYTDSNEEEHVIKYQRAALINTATGSGKSYICWRFLEKVFSLRERFKKYEKYKNTPDLKILVLGDRIDLINQLKESFISGNAIKWQSAIFSDTFKQSLTVEKNHSKVKVSEILNIPADSTGNNEIVFSTFQTAKNNIDTNREFNIIVIDEAHHLTSKEFKQIFERFYKPFDFWDWGPIQLPVVICLTATPTEELKKLIWNEIVDFSLPLFLASKYAPKVEYRVVTNTEINEEKIQEFQNHIKNIKNITTIQEKKDRIKLLETEINTSLTHWDFETDNVIIKDLINRIPNLKTEKTILFAPSIKKANQITSKLNQVSNQDQIATAYHSASKEKNIIETFSKQNSSTKILVVVNKLNEWVDMPFVDNVIFMRGTSSPIVFMQQFGRWLRWDFVKFYDYAWGIKNLVWIDGLIQEVKELSDANNIHVKINETDITPEIGTLKWWKINIYDILWKLQEIKESMTLEVAKKEQIMMLYKNEEIQDKELSKRDYLKFAQFFNTHKANKYKFRLPQTWTWFKNILWIQEKITHKNDIITVLTWGELLSLRKATIEELQILYNTGKLDITRLTRAKYNDFIIEFDKQYSETYGFMLQRSWYEFNTLLWLEKHKRTRKNIQTILEWKQIRVSKNIKKWNKETAIKYFKKGIIKEYFLSTRKWKAQQQEILEKYNIQFPQSLEWFICLLLWSREVQKIKNSWKKIPRNKAIIIHLLLWKDIQNLIKKELATKKQLIDIKESLIQNLTGRRLKNFIKENASNYNFRIPHSLNGIISVLWWNKSISSWAEYIIHLLNGWWANENFRKPKATIDDIAKLLKKWEINIYDLSRIGWNRKYQYLKQREYHFTLPKYNSLIFIITGISKWGRTGKEYLFEILEKHIARWK